MADDRGFGWGGFLWRWLLCLVLVLLTFNPTSISYYGWVVHGEGLLALKVLAGVVLLIVFAFVGHATWESLGPFGLVLAVAFFAALIWVLVDFGLLSVQNSSVLTWVILVVAATILAIGMSFSLLRRRVTGQVDVDDVDD